MEQLVWQHAAALPVYRTTMPDTQRRFYRPAPCQANLRNQSGPFPHVQPPTPTPHSRAALPA
ncbi:hypothetical protein [Donghicola mangrovi]|uniref:Uncharacterized protein n=1 Tax=Donghicola mangrovi TaxID=2729614 RepID=A0A850QC86_9RHOB|nr:hypothetical protein [Donghicola mangrovi]NVO24045.1 hypothetical protein [Donghicola mangrovi]